MPHSYQTFKCLHPMAEYHKTRIYLEAGSEGRKGATSWQKLDYDSRKNRLVHQPAVSLFDYYLVNN